MCFSFNNSHVCYLVSDRLPDLCLWNWRLRCLSWKSDWELVVGFIWILVQESKTTNRHFEKWHESDMKGIIYVKRQSSDFQNASRKLDTVLLAHLSCALHIHMPLGQTLTHSHQGTVVGWHTCDNAKDTVNSASCKVKYNWFFHLFKYQ